MNKSSDIITYDLKIKTDSGKYLFLDDNLISYDAAIKVAKKFISKKNKNVHSVQIWKTRNGMTTSFIHEEK